MTNNVTKENGAVGNFHAPLLKRLRKMQNFEQAKPNQISTGTRHLGSIDDEVLITKV